MAKKSWMDQARDLLTSFQSRGSQFIQKNPTPYHFVANRARKIAQTPLSPQLSNVVNTGPVNNFLSAPLRIKQTLSNPAPQLQANISNTLSVWPKQLRPIGSFGANLGATRYAQPMLETPRNIKTMTNPQLDWKQRGMGALGTLGGAVTAVPDITDPIWMGYDLIKGIRASSIRGGNVFQNIKSGSQALSYEKPVGLGTAWTTDPTGEMVGNIGEFPLAIGAGHKISKGQLLGFDKKTLETARQGFTPEVKSLIKQFAFEVENAGSGANRKNLKELGDYMHSLAGAIWGDKKTANLTNKQLKNAFDVLLEQVDKGSQRTSFPIGLNARSIRGDSVIPEETRRIGTTGQYVGAPQGTTTPEALETFRKHLTESARRGEAGAKWYKDSGDAVLSMFGGDREKATKFSQLLAIYSPATSVDQNFGNALKAWSQFQSGQPIKAGRFGWMDQAATNLLQKNVPWSGRKTNSFYRNIVKSFNPQESAGPVTVDMWIMRALGYKTDSPAPQQYEFAQREIQRVAGKLGWDPEQVQAAIWFDAKARALKKPIAELEPRGFADAAEKNYGQISWEAAPSKTSGLFPELHNAPWEQKMEFHAAKDQIFYDKNGTDLLAKELGMPVSSKLNAPGVFEGQTSPGTQFIIPMPKGHKAQGVIDPGMKTLLDEYSAARALYTTQDAVAYHRPFYDVNVGKMNGTEVVLGKTIDPERANLLDVELQKAFGGNVGQVSTPNGVRLVDFGGGVMNNERYGIIRGIIDRLFPGDTPVTLRRFATDGNYISNDWTTNTHGEDYRRILQARRPDLLRRLDALFSEKAEAVNRKFADKYGWTDGRPGKPTEAIQTKGPLGSQAGFFDPTAKIELPKLRLPWQKSVPERAPAVQSLGSIIPPTGARPEPQIQRTQQPQPPVQTTARVPAQQSPGTPVGGTGGSSYKPSIPSTGGTDKYAFNINKKRLGIEGDADKKLSETVEQMRPILERRKGKPLTDKQIIESGRKAAMLNTVMSRKESARFSAALQASRNFLKTESSKKGLTPEFLAQLEIVSSHAADKGRELRAFAVNAEEAGTKEVLIRDLQKLGIETKRLIDAAKNVDWDDAAQVTEFYRKFKPATFFEKLEEYRYVNMLSSPSTQIVNTFSNLLQGGVITPIEKTVTGSLDFVRSRLTGTEQKYFASQGVDYAKGYWRALPEAWKTWKSIFKGEGGLNKPDVNFIPTGTSKLHKIYTTPLRVLEATDQFFRKLVIGGETKSLERTGITGAEALKKAEAEATYRTFRQAFDPDGKLGQGGLLKLWDKWNVGINQLRHLPGGRWIVPFLQTPTNILKQGVEYSPLGVATIPGSKEPMVQLSKAIIGSTVFVGAYGLADAGLVTWDAPVNKKDRDAFYDAGLQPYSVKIGNTWVSYSKLGPISYPIAMAAAMKWAKDNNGDEGLLKTAGMGVGGFLQFFADQSYMQGIGDIIDAVRGDEYKQGRSFANIPSQLIPYRAFQGWVARLVDPVYRKTSGGGIFEQAKKSIISQTPFASKTLEPYTNSKGEPSQRSHPFINAVSPMKVSEQTSQYMPGSTKSIVAEISKLKTPEEKRALWDAMVKEGRITKSNVSDIKLGFQDREMKLTEDEKSIRNEGVQDGSRARSIVSELNKLKTPEEKRALWERYVKAKILTKDVSKQVKLLLQ